MREYLTAKVDTREFDLVAQIGRDGDARSHAVRPDGDDVPRSI